VAHETPRLATKGTKSKAALKEEDQMPSPAREIPVLPQARTEALVVRELSDETLLYDLKNHQAHCLNQTAAFIWEQCDGKTTVAEMTRLCQLQFTASVDERMVWLALTQLERAGLLTHKVSRPPDVRHQSRRLLLGKLSLTALTVVPLVTSIIAPTALAGASCVGQGGVQASECCTNCCATSNRCIVSGTVGDTSGCFHSCECASGCCNQATLRCIAPGPGIVCTT
jgi:hypothetical protein